MGRANANKQSIALLKEQIASLSRAFFELEVTMTSTRLHAPRTRCANSLASSIGKLALADIAADGRVALVNTRSDLPKLASGNRLTGTPEEYSTIMKGAHAFFETFTVDEAAKTFTIKITGSLYPNEIGASSLRSVTSIDKDRLRFTYPGGGGATADAIWVRAQ